MAPSSDEKVDFFQKVVPESAPAGRVNVDEIFWNFVFMFYLTKRSLKKKVSKIWDGRGACNTLPYILNTPGLNLHEKLCSNLKGSFLKVYRNLQWFAWLFWTCGDLLLKW